MIFMAASRFVCRSYIYINTILFVALLLSRRNRLFDKILLKLNYYTQHTYNTPDSFWNEATSLRGARILNKVELNAGSGVELTLI